MAAGKLIVGAIGALIELNLEELNSSCVWDETNFTPGTDTVRFNLKYSDGTDTTFTGTLLTDSKVTYTTTAATDLKVAGRCEIQVEVTTSGGDVIPFDCAVVQIGKNNFS